MKNFTKLFVAIAVFMVAISSNAKTEYEVDQKFTSIAELDGKFFAVVDETPATPTAMGIGVSGHNNGWDMYFGTITEAYNSNACYYKLEAAQGDGLDGYYYLRTYKADGNMYTAWGNNTNMGYFNSQPATGGCCFALGLNNQNGQDGLNLAVWAIEVSEGKFSLKNIGTGLYLHSDSQPAKYEDAFHFTFCTLKEAPQTDPLADQKDALTEAIALGKMYNAVAYTEASFATLTAAVSAGETALADAAATAESLTAAATAITDAIGGLTLADGYSVMTKEMFKDWASHDATEGTVNTGCAYDINKESDMLYGLSTVHWLSYADLSEYDQLIIVTASGAPRFCFNRIVDGGQDNDDISQSKMIDIPNKSWGTQAYQTIDETGRIFTINLKKMVEEQGFAHLHAIKGANWAKIVVTDMLLTKGTATGINTAKAAAVKGEVFNLAGQKLAAPVKGFNIIDGKKVLVK